MRLCSSCFLPPSRSRTKFPCNTLGEEAGEGRSGADSGPRGLSSAGLPSQRQHLYTRPGGWPTAEETGLCGRKACELLPKENRLGKYLICGLIHRRMQVRTTHLAIRHLHCSVCETKPQISKKGGKKLLDENQEHTGPWAEPLCNQS